MLKAKCRHQRSAVDSCRGIIQMTLVTDEVLVALTA